MSRSNAFFAAACSTMPWAQIPWFGHTKLSVIEFIDSVDIRFTGRVGSE